MNTLTMKRYADHVTSLIVRGRNAVLSGGKWTFAFLALTSAVVALFLAVTVHSRPIEEVFRNSFRVEHILRLWREYGFFDLVGLGWSEPPTVNPKALVYRSRPPMFLYPLYFMNVVNQSITGEAFSFRFYVWYPQLLHWLAAAGLGYLGFRVARRCGTTPMFAVICAMVGQGIFQTFPQNLEWYFEPLPEQVTCLLLILFLICEERETEKRTRTVAAFSTITLVLLVYLDKSLAIPALAAYLLTRTLFGACAARHLIRIAGAGMLGGLLHGLQLLWALHKFPDITLVGSTLLYRSGLDGATNQAGLLTLANLGSANIALRNVALAAFILMCACLLRSRSAALQSSLLLLALPLEFYLISGYFLSQWAAVHPYLHDIFLSVAAVMMLCFICIPYCEQQTGNSGLIVWVLFLVGFCFCMYQLRRYAIMHPLPIPEPNWRAYRHFG